MLTHLRIGTLSVEDDFVRKSLGNGTVVSVVPHEDSRKSENSCIGNGDKVSDVVIVLSWDLESGGEVFSSLKSRTCHLKLVL